MFWIPATVFGALFIVNTVCLLNAINSEARETFTEEKPTTWSSRERSDAAA